MARHALAHLYVPLDLPLWFLLKRYIDLDCWLEFSYFLSLKFSDTAGTSHCFNILLFLYRLHLIRYLKSLHYLVYVLIKPVYLASLETRGNDC